MLFSDTQRFTQRPFMSSKSIYSLSVENVAAVTYRYTTASVWPHPTTSIIHLLLGFGSEPVQMVVMFVTIMAAPLINYFNLCTGATGLQHWLWWLLTILWDVQHVPCVNPSSWQAAFLKISAHFKRTETVRGRLSAKRNNIWINVTPWLKAELKLMHLQCTTVIPTNPFQK